MRPWKCFRLAVLWAWTAFCLLTAFTVFFSTHHGTSFYGTLSWAIAQVVAWAIPFLIIRLVLRLASMAWAKTVRAGGGKAAMAVVKATRSSVE